MTACACSWNHLYLVEDISSMIKQCTICQQCKPPFYKPVDYHIVEATKTFESLNIDFKLPLPSSTKNICMWTIIEYSRLSFVYPCPATDTSAVNYVCIQLFSLFGMPWYVHSDWGPSFMGFLTLNSGFMKRALVLVDRAHTIPG